MCSPRRFLCIACLLLYPIAAMAHDRSALSNLVRSDLDGRGFPVSSQPNMNASGQAAEVIKSVRAHAEGTNEVFLLPDSRAGEAYQLDIETLLREKYRMKIETTTREAILQWFLADGELPPGLMVRTNGNVVGTPETPRERPYLFRVRLVDRAATDADELIVSFSLIVAPPRLRLIRIENPALVPVDKPLRAAGPQPVDTPRIAQPKVLPTPIVQPATGVNNRTHLSMAGEVINSPSDKRGMLKKIVGAIGLGNGPGGGPKPQGCDEGSGERRVVSDEAHNPLEGDTSTQSTCVEFHNLNTLKYRVEFNTKTTRTEGPDLGSLPFLPKLAVTTTTPAPHADTPSPAANNLNVSALAARTVGPSEAAKLKARSKLEDELKTLDERFNKATSQFSEAETYLRHVEENINQSVNDIQNAHNSAIRLANAADSYLQSNTTDTLVTQVSQTKTVVENALVDWPAADISTAQDKLTAVSLKLESLRVDEDGTQDISKEAWSEWLASNQDRFSGVKERIGELKAKITTINGGLNAFNQAKDVLAGWNLVLENVEKQKAAAFEQQAFVSCHTDEGESKASKLTISKTDRTSENPTAVTREVLTVNCYSRVAFTAGFNFSTLDEKDFSVVQAAGSESGTTVKKFGFTNRSSFRPNPLALLNIRFTDNPEYNWHASFGAVVDLKGQTGTDVEPVAGVSFSIRRLIFITPFALHFGRVNKLAGGFKEGDVVPESIATPPIEKAWKVGYTGGITFRIAPQ